MQQLHLVGFTADNRGLIFSARKGSKSGGFVVTVDDGLLERVDEAVARREAEEGGIRNNRPKSALSPREIQARLRAGRTISQVAREAGVEEEWVARWAAPIQAEQGQVVEQAQVLTLEKNRVGASTVPLGEAVRWNMADKGIVFTDAGWSGSWDAFHLRDNSWVVRFSYAYRKRTNQAEWEVDTREGTLFSRNRQGTELGFVAPGRRRPKPAKTLIAPPEAAPAAEPTEAADATRGARRKPAKKAVKRGGATKATRKTTGRKAAAKKPITRKAASKKSPAKKSPAKRAAAPAKTSGARKTAGKKPAGKKTAGKKTASKRAAARKPTGRKPASKKAGATRSAAPAKKSTRKAGARAKKAPGRRPAGGSTGRSPARAEKKPASVAAAASPRPAQVSSTSRPSAPPPVRQSSSAARPRPAPVAKAEPRRPAPQVAAARPEPERPKRQAPRKPPTDSRPADPANLNDSENSPESQMESFPRPAARAPIRIDSGVPRREPSSPIIHAERASEPSQSVPAVSANGSDNGGGKQGRFRFRRGRNR